MLRIARPYPTIRNHQDVVAMAFIGIGLWSMTLVTLMHFAGVGPGVIAASFFGVGFLLAAGQLTVENRSLVTLAIPALVMITTIIVLSTLMPTVAAISTVASMGLCGGMMAVLHRQEGAGWGIISVGLATGYAMLVVFTALLWANAIP